MTKKQIKRIQHLFAAALLLLTVLMMQPLTAFADDKQYQVDAADFNVSFTENGDACITEDWIVTYTRGSFTRFYKDIYNPNNQLEYIQDIRDEKCQINGKDAVAQNNSTERIDGNYYLEKQTDKYTIHWFQSAENESVQYHISYVIPNAVKLDEHNRAEFCYRFIGTNFPKRVSSVSASFDLLAADSTLVTTVSQGTTDCDGKLLLCTADNVDGMYKIKLDMDAGSFHSLGRIVDVQIPADLQDPDRTEGPTAKEVFTFLFGILQLLLIPAGFIFCIVMLCKIPEFKRRHNLKKNPDLLPEAAERLERMNIPYEWYTMIATSETHIVDRY
ncbi:MAG: DUF2207 domain-containing protein, partial [Oscillospiraceae bacterium]|nr:DUF2207 domain-containing protein [Oscillospiraceae bacterium]